MCKIEGCDKESMYKTQDVCQMHYFRFMRNGTYEKLLTRKYGPRGRKYRNANAAGYQMLDEPNHPLAMANGYVYEHRMIIYAEHGENLPPCEFCGKNITWGGYQSHIDHIDEDVTNNNRSNLRILCNGCNVKRTKKDYTKLKSAVNITYQEETKTAAEWARDDRVSTPYACICQRARRGLSPEDVLFMPKLTHNGRTKRNKNKI